MGKARPGLAAEGGTLTAHAPGSFVLVLATPADPRLASRLEKSVGGRLTVVEHIDTDTDQARLLQADLRPRAVVVDLGPAPERFEVLRALDLSTTLAICRGKGASPRIEALRHGARDALSMPADGHSPDLVQELALRVIKLVGLSCTGGAFLDEMGQAIEVNGQRVALTPTEYRLLSVLMSDAGRPFSRTELLQAVWGFTVGPDDTVAVHVNRLRSKLRDEAGAGHVIDTIRGRGYRYVMSAAAHQET